VNLRAPFVALLALVRGFDADRARRALSELAHFIWCGSLRDDWHWSEVEAFYVIHRSCPRCPRSGGWRDAATGQPFTMEGTL
jgi:hypothetical protein